MSSPYSGLEDYRFWRRGVSAYDAHRLNPVVKPKFSINKFDRVATAGSCFAQHISRKLGEYGFLFFTPEDGGPISPAEIKRRNFKIFSARYGNIYTVRQLRQLIEEAFEGRSALDRYWSRPDGRFADPKRPQIEPDGFASPDDVMEDRSRHLAAVRKAFEHADILVFTLGLTEAWRSIEDGSVFPLAPGVAAGEFDPSRYQFVNFDVVSVMDDLNYSLQYLKNINPRLRVLLTISPVPLIATYEDRNVLVATTYSKSVLRVAADVAARDRDWVDYFPSYEIITGSPTGGLYYEDDFREVNSRGVAHAMRCFMRNYTDAVAPEPSFSRTGSTAGSPAFPDIVCDEEAIERLSGN